MTQTNTATAHCGAVYTAQHMRFFDLSGWREYVGSRDSVPTIADAPSRLISPEMVRTARSALRLISVCRKAKKNGWWGRGTSK